MKKIVLMMLAVGVVMMVGCKKTEEGEGPSGGNGTDTAAVVKHNVELVYGQNINTMWQHIEIDTIQMYCEDKSVDTIFIVPERYNQFSTASINSLNVIVSKLRERHNVNPDKVFGKGELQLYNDAVFDHPEIVRFFADTLGYTVTYDYNKSIY